MPSLHSLKWEFDALQSLKEGKWRRDSGAERNRGGAIRSDNRLPEALPSPSTSSPSDDAFVRFPVSARSSCVLPWITLYLLNPLRFRLVPSDRDPCNTGSSLSSLAMSYYNCNFPSKAKVFSLITQAMAGMISIESAGCDAGHRFVIRPMMPGHALRETLLMMLCAMIPSADLGSLLFLISVSSILRFPDSAFLPC